MGVASSSIRLNDGVTGVLTSMNRAMNLFTSGLTDAKKAMGANINTAMFDNAITASKNAVAQMALLERQAQETKAATERAATPKVFQWQNTGQTRVFQDTGMKRLEQETQGVTAKLNQLSRMQREIKTQAAATNILPPQASTELERAQNRLSVLMHSMSNLKNQDMSILNASQVNAMNASFEQMRQKQFDLIRTMFSMQNNFKLGNIAGLNADMSSFTRQIQQAEIHARSMSDYMKQIKSFKWENTGQTRVFQDTGMKRLEQETQGVTAKLNQLSSMQRDIKAQAAATNILPPQASTELERAQNRLSVLMHSMSSLKNQDMSILNTSQVNAMNASFEQMRQKQFDLTRTMSNMQNNFKLGNIAGLNADMSSFTRQIQQAEIHARSMSDYMKQIKSFKWDSGNPFQVFQSSGMTRMRQELSSMQQMTQQLIQRQQTLTNQSSRMKLISPTALNDINQVNARISGLQKTLQTLERQKARVQRFNPSSVNQYNARIENIRHQLSSIIQEQHQWNAALRSNNIEQVNQSYKRMKDLINQTETDIRDNTGAQNQFNNSLNRGVSSAGLLKNQISGIGSRIKSFIGMYASMQGIKMGIGAADSYVSNNARLNLINDGLKTQLELQNQIYASSLRARSNYNDTVNVVAKLGMLAKENFGSTEEIVQFTELMNKSFKLSGASTMERTSGMYQLSQAMAAGKLQGDEFRSIMENAPLLADYIARYTGNTKAELKKMSSDGAITADIIKGALFMAADEIEERYAQMPMTFGDIMNQISSTATMIFRPVMEQFNGMLNSESMSNAMLKVADVFHVVALNVSVIGSHISQFVQLAAPGLSVIAGGFAQVGRYILSADGLMGTFFRTATRLAKNTGVQKFFTVLSKGALMAAQGIGMVMNFVGGLSETFSGFLPVIAGGIVAFTTYQAITAVVTTTMNVAKIATIGVSSVMQQLSVITGVATAAQHGLNTAMAAFPGTVVAGAIMTVVAALGSLVAGIVAVNKAAGLTANNPNIGGYSNEAWRKSEKTGYSMSTSQMLVDNDNDLKKNAQNIREEKQQAQATVDLAKTLASQKDNKGSQIKLQTMKASGELAQAENFLSEGYATKRAWATKYYNQRINEAISLEKAKNSTASALENAWKGVEGLDLDYSAGNPNIDTVGKVGSVDKINDTVDIANEDLRYFREAAEKMAINYFTQNAIAPQINVTFGDVEKTVDIDEVVTTLTTSLEECIATAASGVPAI